MKLASIAVAVAGVALVAGSAFGQKATDGTYFVANSEPTIVVKLENKANSSREVLVERFGADGSAIDSVNATVDPQGTKAVRLEPHAEMKSVRTMIVTINGQPHRVHEPQRTWIRVLGKSVLATASSEYIEGNHISLLDIVAKKAKVGRVNISDTSSPGEYDFVNLSEVPLHIGICREAVWSGSCYPVPSDVVPPHGIIAYPIEQGYIQLNSTERCSFVTSKIFYSTGVTKTFDTDTSVTFDKVK